MDLCDTFEVDKDLFALGYAYSKMTDELESGIKPVDEKIAEMVLR